MDLEKSRSLNASLQEKMEEISLASRNSQTALIEKDVRKRLDFF